MSQDTIRVKGDECHPHAFGREFQVMLVVYRQSMDRLAIGRGRAEVFVAVVTRVR
jgi:hypothetical protein